MMVSLIKAKIDDHHGLLAVRPSSSRTPSSSSADGWTSERRNNKAGNAFKGKAVATNTKPWADQPWPLIDLPSRTQQITHPALHVANDLANIHNAMIRGLNAIYLQAPHVREAKDIADLLFLTQSWCAWLLDHHELKENTMLPRFEAALGAPAGTLTLSDRRSVSHLRCPSAASVASSAADGENEEERISFLLHRVYAYASATHKEPQAYDAVVLEALLGALAHSLVPHLTAQIGLLASMREMCLGAFITAPTTTSKNIPAPLPLPMVTITRTALPSPPISPSSSTFSSSSAASSTTSLPNATLSLFPTPGARARTHHSHSHHRSISKPSPPRSEPSGRDMEIIDVEATERLARARALLEADDRANRLLQVYLTAEAQATGVMDRFVVPPMMVRLRDVTYSSSSSSLPSPSSSSSSLSNMGSGGRGMGVGGGNMSAWPRMSVPAIHAVADKLSPRHEGAWRFLPCDVWGRPRELTFVV